MLAMDTVVRKLCAGISCICSWSAYLWIVELSEGVFLDLLDIVFPGFLVLYFSELTFSTKYEI